MDGLIEALPLIGFSVSAKYELIHLVLVQLVPWLFMMGGSLVTVAVLKFLGVLSTGTFLTLMGGGFLATKKPQPTDSTVKIEVGKIKIGWQGAGALGLIVAGILVIVLAFLGYGYSPNF
jgi:amino acid transporter